MAPLAVKLAELPEQMVAELTVIVGVALTVTELVADEEQVPIAPTIEYTVLTDGVAMTDEPVDVFKSTEGDQL